MVGGTKSQQTESTSPKQAVQQYQKWNELLGPKIFPVSSRAILDGIHSRALSSKWHSSSCPVLSGCSRVEAQVHPGEQQKLLRRVP